MDQTPNLVANDPKKVVTALRIIEREERWAGPWDNVLKETVPYCCLHKFIYLLEVIACYCVPWVCWKLPICR